jgi:hypothetical protein
VTSPFFLPTITRASPPRPPHVRPPPGLFHVLWRPARQHHPSPARGRGGATTASQPHLTGTSPPIRPAPTFSTPAGDESPPNNPNLGASPPPPALICRPPPVQTPRRSHEDGFSWARPRPVARCGRSATCRTVAFPLSCYPTWANIFYTVQHFNPNPSPKRRISTNFNPRLLLRNYRCFWNDISHMAAVPVPMYVLRPHSPASISNLIPVFFVQNITHFCVQRGEKRTSTVH